jgi:Holliday junction resolvase
LESEHPQIDVFAKDELSAIVVECKEKKERGQSTTVIHDALEKIDSYSQYLDPAIKAKYGTAPPPFIGYVLATRNIEWTQRNLDRAKERRIAVLRDEELNYFDDLANILGSPARFQLMGELFGTRSIPRMRDVKVPAIKGRHNNTNYYQFAIDPETLSRISFVQHKAHVSRDGKSGYQRLLKKSKLTAISSYINKR